MEKIDLNNYEAYFLDYMEGTLSAEEKLDLFAFLEIHPELKAEMEADFGAVELIPEKILFEEKEALKIDEAALILTPDTVDDLMIASVEGQLTAAHKTQLEAYIKANKLEKTYACYQATTLKPDLTIVYAEKADLKVKTGIVISLPFITRVAAVAAVGIVLITLAVSNWNAPGTMDASTIENSAFAGSPKDYGLLDLFRQERTVNTVMNEDNDRVAEEGAMPQQKRQHQPDRIENQLIQQELNNTIAEQYEEEIRDTSTVNPVRQLVPERKELNPDNNQVEDDFAHENDTEEPPSIDEIGEPQTEDLAQNSVKKEEPYKIVTDVAENIVNRDIKFTRDKDLTSNDYVAYGFKLGRFEFEHKKSSR